MARSKLSKKQTKRIKTWQTNATGAMDSSCESGVENKDHVAYLENLVDAVDAGSASDAHEGCNAGNSPATIDPVPDSTRVARADAWLEECAEFDRSKRERSDLRKRRLKKGAKIAFWPISMPVRAILWGQRHWEEFLWGGLERAVSNRRRKKELKLEDKARRFEPDAVPTNLPSLSHSVATADSLLGWSPPDPTYPFIKPHNGTALGRLESARRLYSQLAPEHDLDTGVPYAQSQISQALSRTNSNFLDSKFRAQTTRNNPRKIRRVESPLGVQESLSKLRNT